MVTTSELRYGRPSGEKDRKEAVDCNTSCLFFGPVMLQSSKEKVFGSYLGNETETSSLCSEVFFFSFHVGRGSWQFSFRFFHR